jgi:hypothetical protein
MMYKKIEEREERKERKERKKREKKNTTSSHRIEKTAVQHKYGPPARILADATAEDACNRSPLCHTHLEYLSGAALGSTPMTKLNPSFYRRQKCGDPVAQAHYLQASLSAALVRHLDF